MTTKQLIIQKLEEDGGWVWAGKLAREIHEITLQKESVIERRCRELVELNFIEKELAQVGGEGPRCVRYKIIRQVPIKSFIPSKEPLQTQLI